MHIDEDIKPKVDQFFKKNVPNMGDALGIEFVSFARDKIKATMPVDKNTIQPFGILHGGASVALAETLASIGAWLQLKDDHKTSVGIEINANHIRSVPKGSTVTGIAIPVQIGRRIQVWETKIYNASEKLVCISRCTLAVVDK